MAFEDELQQKLGKHSYDEVDRLILDDLFTKIRVLTDEHKKVLDKYQDLKHLSLNGFGLACLNNLPNIPALLILELRENMLSGEDFNLITKAFPKLRKLKLGLNPIKNLDYFNVFTKSDLSIIDLYDTPLSNSKGYKEALFYKIKTLEIIDASDRDGYTVETYLTDEEIDEDEEEDREFESKEGDGEDEFDEDFDEEEEDLVLSNYDSETGEPKQVKINISSSKNKNQSSSAKKSNKSDN